MLTVGSVPRVITSDRSALLMNAVITANTLVNMTRIRAQLRPKNTASPRPMSRPPMMISTMPATMAAARPPVTSI